MEAPVRRRADLGLPRGECGITEWGAPAAGVALRVTGRASTRGHCRDRRPAAPGPLASRAPSRGSPSGSPNKTRSSDCLVATTRINNYEQKDKNTKDFRQLLPHTGPVPALEAHLRISRERPHRGGAPVTHVTDGVTEARKELAYTRPASKADALAPESALSTVTSRCWFAAAGSLEPRGSRLPEQFTVPPGRVPLPKPHHTRVPGFTWPRPGNRGGLEGEESYSENTGTYPMP